MNREFNAANPIDLVAKVEAELRAIGKNPSLALGPEWDEKQQVYRFLREVAESSELLQYPLTLIHTSRIRPDFKLSLPTATVGIEASRISNEAYQRLDSLHRQGMTPPVIEISHTLVRSLRRKNDALVAATVPCGDWNTPSSEQAFWKQQAQAVVEKKTAIRRQADYQDYGINWLVLWDRLPGDEFQTHEMLLSEILTSYWTADKVFDVIVLESEELKEFSIYSRDGLRHYGPTNQMQRTQR